MAEDLQKTIKEELAKLSDERREAVESFPWLAITEEIAKKHLLLEEEEITALQTEVLIGLLGLTYDDAFVTDIEDEVGTTKEEAGKIAEELKEKVFYPILAKMQEKIKEKIKSPNLDWKEGVNFIASGGDYLGYKKKEEDGNQN